MYKIKPPTPFAKFTSAIALVVFILFLTSNTLHQVDCTMEKSPVRPIVQSTIPIEGSLGLTGVNLENFGQLLMVSTPELLIAARHGCNEVVAFNLQTGDIVWRTDQDDPEQKRYEAINYPSNLTLDHIRDQIYVSGFYEIRAIALDNGSAIWRNTSDEFSRNAHYVVIQNDGQLTVNTNQVWYIDAASGSLSKTPIDYEPFNTDFVPTVDPQVERILSTLHDYEVLSNAVRKNGIIYVLDSNAKLHLLNLEDGKEIGSIQFEQPKKTNLLYAPGAIGGSWIAVEDGIIAIYFQDTDVLAVYKIDP